jgi:hypothetical protein
MNCWNVSHVDNKFKFIEFVGCIHTSRHPAQAAVMKPKALLTPGNWTVFHVELLQYWQRIDFRLDQNEEVEASVDCLSESVIPSWQSVCKQIKITHDSNAIYSCHLSPIYQLRFRWSGAPGMVVVEAICYKPEGGRFETRWSNWFFFFILPEPSGRNKYFLFIPPLTEMKSILKNGGFWVVTPCGSCKNRRFGGTWRLLHQGDKNRCTRKKVRRNTNTWYFFAAYVGC